MSAEWTQSDLAAIRAAIAKGEMSVQFADRMVMYRSMADLLRAEQRIIEYLTGRRRGRMRTAVPQR
jgi:hypothetical protein